MTKTWFDVITIGDCKADHFIKLADFKILGGDNQHSPRLQLPLGQKIPVASFKFFAGGNALNAAVGFSRLRLRTAIVSSLGKDLEAERILECARKEGISTDFIVRDKTASTPQTMILVVGGERVILGYAWEADYVIPSRLPASWVYLTSLGGKFRPVYHKVAALKNRDKFRLAYNPGTRQLLSHLSAVKRIIKISDAVFVNVQEAQLILHTRARQSKFLLDGLLSLGCEMAVITDGRKGAVCSNQAEYLKIGAYPARRIDATGAGDAFASGFIAGLIADGMNDGLRWGSVNAAGEIAQVGVHNGLLRKSEMRARLNNNNKFVAKKF